MRDIWEKENMNNEIKMPERIARVICEMQDVCYGEGQCPDSQELLLWISKNFPYLKEEYSYLNWPK